jgi:predicted anti-sigma-YlaC factor YlaD
VAAHLARCAECRAFEQPVRAFTEELRAAKLESPERPVYLPRVRRRVSLVTAEYSVAATLLMAILGGAMHLGTTQSEPANVRSQTDVANLYRTTWAPELELAQIEPHVPVGPADPPAPLRAV